MITVITPTGDRPLAFSLCRKWIFNQTIKPDQHIIVDDGKIPMIIEDLQLNAKTKDFKAILASLNLENQKVLLILAEKTDNVYLAARNLGRVKVVTTDSFNTFDVLNAGKVVLAESSIDKIQTILN